MTKLTHEEYQDLLKAFAQDILSIRERGEEACLIEYAACSEYTFKPNKSLELLAVSENTFTANKGDEFINPIHYDGGVLAENVVMEMALNALVMDISKAIDDLS